MSEKLMAGSISEIAAAQAQVLRVIHSFHAALIDADTESLDALLCRDFSYGSMAGAVINRIDFIREISTGAIVFSEIELLEKKVTLSYETAIARFAFMARMSDKGTENNLKITCLLVLQKQNEEWRLLAAQVLEV